MDNPLTLEETYEQLEAFCECHKLTRELNMLLCSAYHHMTELLEDVTNV